MQQQINLSLADTSEVFCDKCDHTYFHQALYLRKASGLLTGTGQTSYIPLHVFACDKCGHVNSEFLPKEVQSLE
jgi:hypothetical protein